MPKWLPRHILWIIWITGTALFSILLVITIMEDWDKHMFLPGQTTHGHYQIELDCKACHTPFMGVKQDACLNCHGKDLEESNDTHPPSKFTNPGNAHLVENIKAHQCITCHKEHAPEITHSMGVTLPLDYCAYCHQNISDDVPSHKDIPFSSCSTVGCHNFHDNRALYKDFLIKNVNQPNHLSTQTVPLKTSNTEPADITPDVPDGIVYSPTIHDEWLVSSHARNGVNCKSCHEIQDPETRQLQWLDKPGYDSCGMP